MTRDEAIERLHKWHKYNAILADNETSSHWAHNFYAESLRDMTAAVVLITTGEDKGKDLFGMAQDLTHAMIERLTNE